MAKISTAAYDSVKSKATLQEQPEVQNTKPDESDVQRQTIVYDLPKVWLAEIRRNKMTVGAYIKHALREKLQRDGMLP